MIVLMALGGFLWGTLVSFFNYYWLKKVFQKNSSRRAKIIFICRWLIYMAALFVVSNYTAVLVGTALGLVSVKNITLIKTINKVFIHKGKG